MSIRIIARDLYRLQKEVEKLEQELANCPPGEREPLQRALEEAKKARDRAKSALEGVKEQPSCRKPR